MIATIQIFILGLLVLGILVFVHELGHFLVAKACGVRVLAFSIGFGNPLFRKEIGGTEYRIGAVPFGGYVHMAGEHPEDEHEKSPDEFTQKPIWQRALVALAGPSANYLLAIVLLWGAFMFGMEREVYLERPVVGDVAQSSAAAEAGLAPGDSIAAINDEPVETGYEIAEELSRMDATYELTYYRNNDKKTAVLEMPPVEEGKVTGVGNSGIYFSLPPEIDSVTPGLPAAKAGIKGGDTIIRINGDTVRTWYTVSDMITSYDTADAPLTVTALRNDSTYTVTVTPVYDSTYQRHILGMTVATKTRTVRYGPLGAVPQALTTSWDYTLRIFDVVGKLISRRVSPNQLAGPIGIVQMSGQIATLGIVAVLNFMAFIGVNLAVLNLMPLVITDGGMLMFLLLEAIRGKPLSLKHQMIISRIAILLFILLFLFVTFNDIRRIPTMFRMFR
ncbi:MAG: RIP metalloprotease RseP [Chitinivibrionales bacterium]|nr:RIP metalloprotease RseP [Chitinivibrionales bacterium]MBD3356148.1 RIP metalloprotease RseP [Chitinivibrionales bacterium]